VRMGKRNRSLIQQPARMRHARPPPREGILPSYATLEAADISSEQSSHLIISALPRSGMVQALVHEVRA